MIIYESARKASTSDIRKGLMTVIDRPNSLRKRVTRTFRLIRWALVFLASLRIFVRPTVIGRENIPLTGPVIFAFNHRSSFDPIALFGALRSRPDLAFLAKHTLFNVPLLGGFLRWFGTIPVRRGTATAVESSTLGTLVLRAGGAVAASFEGRVPPTGIPPNGYTLPAKKGVSYMAFAAGAPVVPVALVGTERVRFPGKSWWHWSFRQRYVIVIGPPIPVPQLDHEATSGDRADFTDTFVAAVHRLIDIGNRQLVAK